MAGRWFGMGCRTCCPPPTPSPICNYPSKFHYLYGECAYDIWPPWALANPEFFDVFHFEDQCADVRRKLIPPDGASPQVNEAYFTNNRLANHIASCEPHPGWNIGGVFHRGQPMCMESNNAPVHTERWIDPGSHWSSVPGVADGRFVALSQFGYNFPWTVVYNAYHLRQFTRYGYEWDKCWPPPATWPPEKCPENPNESLYDYAQRCWVNQACNVNPGFLSQIVFRCAVRCNASIKTRIYSLNEHIQTQRFTLEFYLRTNDEMLARPALAATPDGGFVTAFDRTLQVELPANVCFGYDDTGPIIDNRTAAVAEYVEVDVTDLARLHGLSTSVIGLLANQEPAYGWHDLAWRAIEGCTFRPGEPEAIDLLGSIYESGIAAIAWSGSTNPLFGINPPPMWLNNPARPEGCAYKDHTGAVPIWNGFWVRGGT